MEAITIPTIEQIKNLDILQEYGIKAEPTDFCKIQNGCYLEDDGNDEYYWTKTQYNKSRNGVLVVEDWIRCTAPFYCHGLRPIIPLAFIDKKIKDVEEIEYGKYPQNIVDKQIEIKLENAYQQNTLFKTKKSYTIIRDEKKEKYQEYKYKGNKYIRVNNPFRCKEINWIKVEPITWLIDEKEKIAISKNILNRIVYSYMGNNDYEESDIKEFLEKDFLKEIQVKIKENKNIDIEKINDLVDIMNRLFKEEKPKQKVK